MLKFFLAVLAGGSMLAATAPAEATNYKRGYQYGPQVKGYAIRRGGYSYSRADTINTNGNHWSPYRAHILNPQSPAGPFDSGFFFDSVHALEIPAIHSLAVDQFEMPRPWGVAKAA